MVIVVSSTVLWNTVCTYKDTSLTKQYIWSFISLITQYTSLSLVIHFQYYIWWDVSTVAFEVLFVVADMFSQPFSQSWFACWTYVAFIAVVKINNSQEVYTWAFLGSTLRELICPNLVCMYVCMYVLCMYVCMYVCIMYVLCIYVCMYVCPSRSKNSEAIF